MREPPKDCWRNIPITLIFPAQRLTDGVRRGQQLVRPRPYSDVFCEICPTHDSRAIDQEFRRAGDICSIRTSAWMQKFVTPNYLSLWVRKKWKRVASFAAEIFRDFGSIDTDGDGQDALRFEFRQRLFDTSQLEVAVRSPVAAVENQQNSFWRCILDRDGKQLR